MFVRNVGKTMVRVADRSLGANRAAEIDDAAWYEWLNRSGSTREIAATSLSVNNMPPGYVAPPEYNAPVSEPKTFIDEVVEAIGRLDKDDSSLWLSDGSPTVAALQDAMGKKVSAAERDEAWEKYHDSHSDNQ